MEDIIKADDFASQTHLDCSDPHNGNSTIIGERDRAPLTGEVGIRDKVVAGVPKIVGGT